MAITEWWVNPGSGTDDLAAGRGESFGDPWASVAYALSTGIPNTGRDAVNGDRVNLIAGTADPGGWDPTNYAATATAEAPLVIEGCTAAAGDGGVASVDGGGISILNALSFDYCLLKNLSMSNWGVGTWSVNLDNNCQLIRCTFDGGGTSTLGVDLDLDASVVGCAFIDITTMALSLASGVIEDCYFQGTAPDMINGSPTRVSRCVFNATAVGVTCVSSSAEATVVEYCTCYNSAAGTEAAVELSGDLAQVLNNYIEGWSGAGGSGIEVLAGAKNVSLWNNYFYNNTANVTDGGYILHQEGSTTLDASALTTPGADFSVNTHLQAKAWPGEFPSLSQTQYMDVGAVQREETGGGIVQAAAGRFGVQEC